MTLASDIALIAADTQILHDIANNDAGSTVMTESGAVDTVARAISKIGNGNYRGAWAGPGTVYAINDTITQSSVVYRCITGHTSAASFATDSAKWIVQNAEPANVTNAQMADMAQATIKGRASGAGTGKPVDLTPALARVAMGPWDDISAMGVINVKDPEYGAVGDGSTDDTAAITAAFTAANASRQEIGAQESGSLPNISGYVISGTEPIVYFPPGKYKITASVGAGSNSIRIVGSGALLISADRTISLLSIGTFNVTVQGMIFDGGKYHIKFGGSRIESGSMYIQGCQFRNAKTRCIFMDRLTDIPGVSGWPAQLRIRDCKSYGSGFLEAYCNGVTIADSWLAWDVSGTTWDGGALIIANDSVCCYNVIEVPFNQAGPGAVNAGRIPRFQDASGVSASEDLLAVQCFGCRFGGEATQTPVAHFRTAGSSLLIEGGGVYGVADGYWLHCDAMPSRITVRGVAAGGGFVNTWGMWFNNSLTLANLPEMCKFDLELQSSTPAASVAITSADKTVNGGTRMAFVPSQGTTVGMRLRNYDVGDSFTWWSAPYGSDAANAAFGGGSALLGHTSSGIIGYSAEGYYGITFPGFNPGVAGSVTFSCWVKATSRSAWYFQNGTVNVANGVLEPGMNRIVVTFCHAGSGATTPKLGLTGKNGDAHVVGFFNFNLGSVAGDWQPASIASDGGNLYGSATYDPPNLSDGAGATTTVTCTGAALGDFARAAFSIDLQGITLTSWVSSANTVSVRFQNESGGTLDLASGILRVRVEKA